MSSVAVRCDRSFKHLETNPTLQFFLHPSSRLTCPRHHPSHPPSGLHPLEGAAAKELGDRFEDEPWWRHGMVSGHQNWAKQQKGSARNWAEQSEQSIGACGLSGVEATNCNETYPNQVLMPMSRHKGAACWTWFDVSSKMPGAIKHRMPEIPPICPLRANGYPSYHINLAQAAKWQLVQDMSALVAWSLQLWGLRMLSFQTWRLKWSGQWAATSRTGSPRWMALKLRRLGENDQVDHGDTKVEHPSPTSQGRSKMTMIFVESRIWTMFCEHMWTCWFWATRARLSDSAKHNQLYRSCNV